MKSLIAPFLFFVCVCACTKDRAPLPTIPAPTYDTVFPGDYLPLYPGSWWEYEIYQGRVLRDSVSNHYQLNSYPFDSVGKKFYSIPRYVPIYCYNGPLPFYKYSTPVTFNYTGEMILLPFLSETVGEFWRSNVGPNGPSYIKVVSKDSSTIIKNKKYNDVLVTYGYSDGTFQRPIVIQFYGFNIGLIQSKTVNYSKVPPDTIITRQILNYYINR